MFLYSNDGRWKLDHDKIRRLSNWVDNDIEDFDKSLDRILKEAFKVSKSGYISQRQIIETIARGKAKRAQARSAAGAKRTQSGRKASAQQPDSGGTANQTEIKPNRIDDPEIEGNLIEPNQSEGDPPSTRPPKWSMPPGELVSIYDRLAVQLKPKKSSDKTCIKKIINHVGWLVKSGQFNGASFSEVYRMADEAGTRGKNRMAYFTTSIKNQFGAWI